MTDFSGNYDKEIIYWLLIEYLKDRDNGVLNDLLTNIAPLVNLVAIGFSCNQDCDIDLISVEALEHIYFLLISDKVDEIPMDTYNHLSTFLWIVIKRSFIDSLRRNRLIDTSSLESPLKSNEYTYSRSLSYKNFDLRLYMEDFNSMLFYMVVADIRFEGDEYRACVFIVSCMLGFVNLSPGNVKYRYKMTTKKVSFFTTYINYLVRVNKKYLLENESE
jgi:hypothetical protein